MARIPMNPGQLTRTIRSLLLALLPLPALLAAPRALPQGVEVDLAKASAAFGRHAGKEQEAIAAALLADLGALDAPGAGALRDLAVAAAAPVAARLPALPRREAGKKAPRPNAHRAIDLPLYARYQFGRGVIDAPALPAKGPAREQAEAARRCQLVVTAALGMLPDTDRALAALLARLDRDARADRFAAFLESWRNGDESFYEALDRTAGTADSVFFYDAMLHDFASLFASGSEEQQALASLRDKHDALHESFLAYRQYRAFREAVAWSCVLPPDLPLPANLQRYEQRVQGAYSLRQQVAMLLAAQDWDAGALADRIAADAPPLPVPLWRAGYDPYPPWNQFYAAALPRMIDAAGDTDHWLARAEQQLTARAAAIRALLAQHLGDKPAAH